MKIIASEKEFLENYNTLLDMSLDYNVFIEREDGIFLSLSKANVNEIIDFNENAED